MNLNTVTADIFEALKKDLGPYLVPAVKDWTFGFKETSNAMGATAMFIPASGEIEQIARHVYHKTIRAFLFFQVKQRPELTKALLKMADDVLAYFDANPVIGGAQVQATKFDVDVVKDGTSDGGLYFDLEILTS